MALAAGLVAAAPRGVTYADGDRADAIRSLNEDSPVILDLSSPLEVVNVPAREPTSKVCANVPCSVLAYLFRPYLIIRRSMIIADESYCGTWNILSGNRN